MRQAADRTMICMTLVYVIALGSKDERTKMGAVVVGPDDEIRTTGYNGLPRGADDDVASRQQKPEKSIWFEHAERNAIYNAARIGVSLKLCTLYTQGTPCAACARAVIQAGITKVVVHKPWDDRNSDNYAYPVARQLFQECGVEIEKWDGALLLPEGWRRGATIPVTGS